MTEKEILQDLVNLYQFHKRNDWSDLEKVTDDFVYLAEEAKKLGYQPLEVT